MSIHFSRSLRRLESGGVRPSALLLAGTVLIICLWAGWFVGAQVAVYATTGSARLEVDRENHPVDSPVGGRVLVVPVGAGQRVQAGDILLQLDASSEQLAQSEAEAGLGSDAHQISSLKDELAAEERGLEEERQSALASRAESESKVSEATAALELALDEAARLTTLRRSGLVSELDAVRAQKLVEQRRSESQAAEFASSRLARELLARQQDRLARIARLNNEIAEIEGQRYKALATADRLGFEIGQRVVRAPISGTLAEVSPLKVGGMVKSGDRVCTIVPDGDLKVVALFAPSTALGRIRHGQSARVRLEGFPWLQYGAASARVSTVAGEVRDGQVRVELALDPALASAIPMQHGLPAEVDIEVEHLSPLGLMLRSAGALLQSSPVPSSASLMR